MSQNIRSNLGRQRRLNRNRNRVNLIGNAPTVQVPPSQVEQVERMLTIFARDMNSQMEIQSQQIRAALQAMMEAQQQRNARTQNTNPQVTENVAAIRRATTAILDLPVREWPVAIKERIISGFKKTLVGGAAAPFTLAGYAAYHGVIMPIPLTIKMIGSPLYKLYCITFTVVFIFGVRYYYIEYSQDERVVQLLNFIQRYLWVIMYPTQKVYDFIINNVLNPAYVQVQRNMQQYGGQIRDLISGIGSAANEVRCNYTPRWVQPFVRC